MMSEEKDKNDLPLFGDWQTEEYQPPIAVDGRVCLCLRVFRVYFSIQIFEREDINFVSISSLLFTSPFAPVPPGAP